MFPPKMGAFFDDEALFARLVREMSENRAKKPRANYEVVVVHTENFIAKTRVFASRTREAVYKTHFPQSTSLITVKSDFIKYSFIPSSFISSADNPPHGCPILFLRNVKLSSLLPFPRLLGKNFTSE